MLRWRIVVHGARDGAWNMACDEALREAADAEQLCTLRLYAWSPPALSFGRNEPALRRYDRAAIAARGLATVRRPTGGRAVWHDREVTYSVAAPLAAFGSLRQTYSEIHATIAEGLRSLGAAVVLAPDRPSGGVGAGPCFASAAGGEVVTESGLKVVGSAQVRVGNAFLQHGSILLESDQQLVASLTLGPAAVPAATGLATLIEAARATWQSVADAVAAAAARRWGAVRSELPDQVARRADELARTFADPAWTWRR
ncbi:MAG TPA: hypothetical protein VNL98_12655 [Gemmatimonadales bacterium]|nr:hypothetical protein [Gemmatimonadales bacterium]